MHINVETLREQMGKRKLTQAALAEAAKVGTKTIGRIFRGEDLRRSNAQKIAGALGVTVEELSAAPTEHLKRHEDDRSKIERLVIDVDGDAINALWMTARRYRVPVRALIQYAPLLFTIVAGISLQRRMDRLETWKAKMEEALASGPAQESYSLDLIGDKVMTAYWSEREAIEKRDLREGMTGDYSTPNSLPEGSKPDNTFFDLLEELASEAGQELKFISARLDSIFYYHSELTSCYSDLFPADEAGFRSYLTDGGPLDDLPSWMLEAIVGYQAIEGGDVTVRDIPSDLLASDDKMTDRIRWIAARYAGADGDLDKAIALYHEARASNAAESESEPWSEGGDPADQVAQDPSVTDRTGAASEQQEL